MHRIYLTVSIFLIFYILLFAGDSKTLKKIAPGVSYYHDFHSEVPWHIHILKIELNHPNIRLQSVKAGNSLFAREKTSLIALANNREKHKVVAAINGDFFELNGKTAGAQIIDGILLSERQVANALLVVDTENSLIDSTVVIIKDSIQSEF
jgi:hypothetical protein